ncbi:thiol peroxidase [bacterium]|nr:thiol peroxidase [bacterium]
MAKITLKGHEINSNGNLPEVGATAPEFTLIKNDLSPAKLSDYRGKKVILNIFPSLDTGVCAASVRKFNAELNNLDNTVVLCISRDLPFAQARFCGAEGLDKVITLSEMRGEEFSTSYGVQIVDGPMAGLMARSVVIINEEGKVTYTELVPEIVQEPDYNSALASLK